MAGPSEYIVCVLQRAKKRMLGAEELGERGEGEAGGCVCGARGCHGKEGERFLRISEREKFLNNENFK